MHHLVGQIPFIMPIGALHFAPRAPFSVLYAAAAGETKNRILLVVSTRKNLGWVLWDFCNRKQVLCDIENVIHRVAPQLLRVAAARSQQLGEMKCVWGKLINRRLLAVYSLMCANCSPQVSTHFT